MTDTEDDRAHAEARLVLLDLLTQALDNRDEVFALISSSADPAEAEERIRNRFNVTAPHISRAVLDMQVSRFTASERTSIAQSAAEVRDELQRLTGELPA